MSPLKVLMVDGRAVVTVLAGVPATTVLVVAVLVVVDATKPAKSPKID